MGVISCRQNKQTSIGKNVFLWDAIVKKSLEKSKTSKALADILRAAQRQASIWWDLFSDLDRHTFAAIESI